MEIKYKETKKFTPEVIKEILKVHKDSGLTAKNLLDHARDKKNPLHGFFEWNNSVASESWRVHQARLLINEVKVIVEDKELYAFENLQVSVNSNDDDNESQREYKSLYEIMTNDEYKDQLITSALKEISFWKSKYIQIKELESIFVSIDKTKKKWQKKQ